MKPPWIACAFLIMAFAPITAAERGLDFLPHAVAAWCFIIGYPAALVSLIGGMAECDER